MPLCVALGRILSEKQSGSDKNYSFSIPAEENCHEVHLFESAIDLLSYATVMKMQGQDWRKEHLLSLAGIYQPAKKIEESIHTDNPLW